VDHRVALQIEFGAAITVSPTFSARAWSGVIGISRVWCAMIVSLHFVIARSEATKQSSSLLAFWIASLRSQ
jgi:hypothetical protein